MIFQLPVKFDANEWEVLGVTVILLLLVLLLPKRFPPNITLVILLFNPTLGMIIDFALATKYPFNLYDTMDTEKYDLFDFILYMITYSLFGYLFLYFYDKWRFQKWHCLLYILTWVLATTFFEWVSMLLETYKYHSWKLAYSSIVYCAIFSLDILMLKISESAYRQIKRTVKIR